MSKRTLLLLTAVAVATACADAPQAPKAVSSRRVVSAESQTGKVGGPIAGEWVVQFREGAPNARGLMQGILQTAGGTLKSEHLSLAGAFVARLPDGAAEGIAKNPWVRSVQPNVALTPMTAQVGGSWGLRRIDQRNRPIDNTFVYPADGKGTNIYFVDTGTDPQHEEFGTRMTGGVSTVGDNIGIVDGCRHGVQVAAVAGGSTHGVAKQATLYAVKVMDRFCAGDVSSYLYGLEWIKQNHVKPAVVNVSVAFATIVPAVDSAVSNLIATAGIPVVVAAGNNAVHSCFVSPARVPEVITVAATDSSDIRAGWSAIGSCVDLYAPGVGILTAWYNYNEFPNDHNDWSITFGTSVAAPFVSGVVASYLQRYPTASPAAVHSHIVNTATAGAVQYPGIDTPNRLLYQAPSSTISISVLGATSVRPGATCGWEAVPTGGAGPYIYTWYKDGVYQQQGTNPLYITTLSSNGTISVSVTDSYGSSANASRSVTVSSSARVCRY